MYFGNLIWFEESFNLVSEPMRNEDGTPSNKMVNNTFIFHTFVLMNLFNTFNCRILGNDWFFSTIFNNMFLWLILAGEMLLQNLMISAASSILGSALLGTAPLTTAMIITSWCLGAFSLVVNRLLLKIPADKFKFSDRINLETNDENILDRLKQKLKAKVDDQYQKYKPHEEVDQ